MLNYLTDSHNFNTGN